MRLIGVGLLTSAAIAFGGLPALAATTGPGGEGASSFRVIEGYVFEVTGARFGTLTITGTDAGGYSLLVNGPEVPLGAGHTFTFIDPVGAFYLRLLNPHPETGHVGGAGVPAVFTLVPQGPTETPNVTVTPMLREDAAPAPLPLPGSAWGLLAGIGGLLALRRRKRAEARV